MIHTQFLYEFDTDHLLQSAVELPIQACIGMDLIDEKTCRQMTITGLYYRIESAKLVCDVEFNDEFGKLSLEFFLATGWIDLCAD